MAIIDLGSGGKKLWHQVRQRPGKGELDDGKVRLQFVGRGHALDFALFYYRLGWAVIPINNDGSKRPTVSWSFYKDKRPDDLQLHRWFDNRFNDCGIAVLNGKSSGYLACRDFDSMQAYEDWAVAHPELARKLPTARTTRGRHVYFRHSALDKTQTGLTGELRVTGINVLPPSKTADGSEYAWLTLPCTDNLQMIEDLEGAGLWISAMEKKRNRASQDYEKKQKQKKRAESLDDDDAVPAMYLPRPSPTLVPKYQVPVDDEIDAAIERTLPQAQGQRNMCIFEFARELKAMKQLTGASPLSLRDAVQRWHSRARSRIKTQEFSETWMDFIVGWDRVKWPKGVDPVALAEQRHKANPRTYDLVGLENDTMQLLAGICRELQRMNEPSPFYLSCERAGAAIGVDKATAWRYLQYFIRLGMIAEAKKGDRKTRRATRFWFLVQDQEEQEGGADDE